LRGVGRCGATGSRLGSVVINDGVGQRTGQVEASDPCSDGGVEGKLSSSYGRRGSGWDRQWRGRGELAAETRRPVIYVLTTSVILIGGKKQLQRPEEEEQQYVSKVIGY